MDGTMAIVRNIEDIQARRRAENAATDLRKIVKQRDAKIARLQKELAEVRREGRYFKDKNMNAYIARIKRQKDEAPEWVLVKYFLLFMGAFGVVDLILRLIFGV